MTLQKGSLNFQRIFFAILVQVLDLSQNPLHCDCHLSWLTQLSVTQVISATCYSPRNVAGTRVTEMVTSHMTCSILNPAQISMLSVCLVIISLMLGIISFACYTFRSVMNTTLISKDVYSWRSRHFDCGHIYSTVFIKSCTSICIHSVAFFVSFVWFMHFTGWIFHEGLQYLMYPTCLQIAFHQRHLGEDGPPSILQNILINIKQIFVRMRLFLFQKLLLQDGHLFNLTVILMVFSQSSEFRFHM